VAKLIYSVIASLDGYTADADGGFGWAAPDEEVFRFVNDLERPIGTYLYGRRIYEVLRVWESADTFVNPSPEMRDFAAIWQQADKVVYSTTLDAVSTSRTRLERAFDPEAIGRLKASASRDITVGGPELAAHAFRAGLVDECQVFLAPVVVGGGTRFLPAGLHLQLDLVDERRFGGGVVYLRYLAAG
jgi:dihydrofolate reductase